MNDHESSKMELTPIPVRVPAEMPEQTSQELELLGLSPEFPEKLQALNSALAKSIGNSHDNFVGYTFKLSPDISRPRIDVSQQYFFPFSVELDVSPQRQAILDVHPKLENATLTTVRVDQLQGVLGEANMHFLVTVFKPFSLEEELRVPLEELNEEMITNVSPSSKITISSHSKPEFDFPIDFTIQASKEQNRSFDNTLIPTLRIKGVEVAGSSFVIEDSLPIISRLAQTYHLNSIQ